MVAAAQDVLTGADPSKAFEITRSPGVDKQPHTLPLALFIHHNKHEKGENWLVVESLAKDWCAERGIKEVGVSRLKTLYAENKADVLRELAFRKMMKDLKKTPID